MSLLEVLAVIAIIGILASVVYVNLSGARQKAQAGSVLQSMTSVAPLAYKCLTKGDQTLPANLNSPPDNICSISEEFSTWPNISSTGWDYSNFFWCNVSSYNPNSCGNYNNGTCGGDWNNKKFCYGITDGTGSSCSSSDKCIWCTDNGCQKSGF